MGLSKGLTAVLLLLAVTGLRCGSDQQVSKGTADVAGSGDTASADAPLADTDAATVGDDAAVDVAADVAADVPIDVPIDVPPPTCTEAQTKACDDGLACTTDECTMPYAVCKWTLVPDTCLIGGICHASGDQVPSDPCRQCDPAQPHAWSLAPTGAPCDDGNACTFNGTCVGGACSSQAVVCGDDNPCTSDACDVKKGCTYPPISAVACSDGSACTSGDTCVVGLCQGATVSCDDANPCTDDSCELATGCTHTDNSAACSDGDACTDGDTCAGGVCGKGGAANCDDGNTCTLDTCDTFAGCYHLPTKSPCCQGVTSICDDGNPCTSDDCGQGGACSHVANSAVCDDGNACTSADVCGTSGCKGSPKVCDDKNPCTSDSCSSQKGCVFTALASGSCDDGDPCTQGDVCGGGVCKGSGQCACTPTFAKQASKLTALDIGAGGKPGEGLDIDANVKTCSPAGNCSGGIDNAFGGMAGLLNAQLDKAVASGSIVLVLEYKDFKQGPINVALYQASLDASNPTCDVQKQSCAYLMSKSMLTAQCAPVVAMSGTLTGTGLVAGGKGTKFPFNLPIGGANLAINIDDVQLVGTAVVQGGLVTSLDAILGGAVPKAELLAAIDAAPEGVFPAGLDKATIKALVDATVLADIDTDGDGVNDAASIGLKIKGIAATITGAK
jgi:hypothetical protein